MENERTDVLLERLNDSIGQDQIYISRDILEILDSRADPKTPEGKIIQEYYKKNRDRVSEVRKNIQEVERLLNDLSSTEGWTKAKEKNGTTVYFKKVPDNPNLMTKVETMIPGEPHELTRTFLKLVALLNETDLFKDWFPQNLMKHSSCTSELSMFSKTVWVKVGLSAPISYIFGPREAHLVGYGFDMSERSSVVILVKTLKEGDVVSNGFECPPLSKGHTQLEMEAVYYFQLLKNGIVFKQIQLLNLNSALIPSPIINFLSKGIVPFETIANLNKMLRKFEGSPWEKRIKRNPELYGEVDKRLAAYLEREFGIVSEPLQFKADADLEDDQSERLSRSASMSSARPRSKSRIRSFVSRFGRKARTRNSRKRSASGRKLSRAAQRSFANLHKQELYDKPITVAPNAKLQTVDVNEGLKKSAPLSTWETFVYYVFFVITIILNLFGQKQRFLKSYPGIAQKYPQLTGDVKNVED